MEQAAAAAIRVAISELEADQGVWSDQTCVLEQVIAASRQAAYVEWSSGAAVAFLSAVEAGLSSGLELIRLADDVVAAFHAHISALRDVADVLAAADAGLPVGLPNPVPFLGGRL